MYKISKWKLVLIIGVFLFSALYLLPTVPGVYGRIYGYFSVWMQGKIPPPDTQSNTNGDFIRFVIPRDDLPKGVSVQEASKSIKDVVSRRLSSLGLLDSEFSFVDAAMTDIYVVFDQAKAKADLEGIVSKLSVGSNVPELPEGEHQGSIKYTVTEKDYPENGGMQEAVEGIRDKIREQLEAQGLRNNEFRFDYVSNNELHVDFSPQKSKAELNNIIDDLQLYGGLPLALRPVFPDKLLKQGLDLKGGLHIVLELDVEKAMDIYLDNQAKELILDTLRREKIPCKSVEKTLEKRGDNMIVLRPYVSKDSETSEAQHTADMRKKLIDMGFSSEDIKDTSSDGPELTAKMNMDLGIGDLVNNLLDGDNPLIVTTTVRARDDKEEFIRTVTEILDRLELFDKPRLLQGKDKTVVFSLKLSEDSAKKLAEDNLDTVIETLDNRINKFGLAESSIRRVQGRSRILIEIPEEQNPARTLAAIKSPGILEFKLVKPNPSTGTGLWSGEAGTTEPSPDELPAGSEVRQHVDGGWDVLGSETFMTGSDLRSNSATVVRGEFGSPEVIMYLTGEGQRKFSDFTGSHVNEFTAIMLDEVIQSTPRITEKISSRSARITGSFTEEEADYLAKILKAGAFPAPMKSAEERIVGPTLGEESINKGKLAFIIGAGSVILFMMIYYKWSGSIAVVALLLNFQIILGVLAGFGATLTLPGMAGLILTIGMSVDANVLIFERIREELRNGKTVRSSIDSGYQKAFWTILDANVTTFLTAIVLYEFGTGPIKGFAVTLSIGIIASMFTALVVTREIYRWAYRKRAVTKLSI